MKKYLPCFVVLLNISCNGNVPKPIVTTSPPVLPTTNTVSPKPSSSAIFENTPISINIPQKSLSLYLFQSNPTYQLSAISTNKDGTTSNEIVWKSLDISVATVDEKGLLTAKKDGIVQIQVSAKKDETLTSTITLNILIFKGQDNSNSENSLVDVIGQILDSKNKPVSNVEIFAITTSMNPEERQFRYSEISDQNGKYILKNVPSGRGINIRATKKGWTQRNIYKEVKINPTSAPNINVINFGGENPSDSFYSLNDEPEVSIKINGKEPSMPGTITSPEKPISTDSISLSELDPNLEIELTFSEPIIKDDVKNFVKIVSQDFEVKNNKNFILDKDTEDFKIDSLSSDKFILRTNKKVLQNKNGLEARYRLEFYQPFRDENGLAGLTSEKTNHGLIRFIDTLYSNSFTFSVKNDYEKLKLDNIQAHDGGPFYKDRITLYYNKPFNVIGNKIYQQGLVNPEYINDLNNKSWGMRTENDENGHNVTILGYNDPKTGFKAVYEIGRLINPINNNSRLFGLGINGDIISGKGKINPSKNGAGLISVDVKENMVIMDFEKEAFNWGDKVIVSVVKNINGHYKNQETNIDLNVKSSNIIFSPLTDTSGNSIEPINETVIENFTVNDSQRVSTAN